MWYMQTKKIKLKIQVMGYIFRDVPKLTSGQGGWKGKICLLSPTILPTFFFSKIKYRLYEQVYNTSIQI